MTDYLAALSAAADEYRRQIERAKEIRREADEVQRRASEQLAAEIRTAFHDGRIKKADIIRATGYVWSRTWVDRAIKTDNTEAPQSS